jgi:hypothetical protein
VPVVNWVEVKRAVDALDLETRDAVWLLMATLDAVLMSPARCEYGECKATDGICYLNGVWCGKHVTKMEWRPWS